MTTTNMMVAETIKAQLGGGSAMYMIGAKDLVALDVVHVGVGSRVYGARTGKDMGGRTNYRTLCSGKQLGGPWGYSASADLDGALCARCSRLARVAS